jgi:hypothetical protein
MTPIERKARELLAAEFDRDGAYTAAKEMRAGAEVHAMHRASLRAIEAALTPPAGGLPELPEVRKFRIGWRGEAFKDSLFVEESPTGCWINEDDFAAAMHAYALEAIAASRVGWLPIESAPVNTTVLLWNRDTQAIDIGHKPDDAPDPDCVVVSCTASYADAWQPLPAAPQVALNRGGED